MAVVLRITFNLYYLHAMQAVGPVTLNYRSVHLMGDGLFSP